jgi:hypothetical protein
LHCFLCFSQRLSENSRHRETIEIAVFSSTFFF